MIIILKHFSYKQVVIKPQTTTPQPEERCTDQNPLDWSCCTPSNPCNIGGGECDRHEDCVGNLVCGGDNCQSEFGYNWHSLADCCTTK